MMMMMRRRRRRRRRRISIMVVIIPSTESEGSPKSFRTKHLRIYTLSNQ